jgi:hypothetical protein
MEEIKSRSNFKLLVGFFGVVVGLVVLLAAIALGLRYIEDKRLFTEPPLPPLVENREATPNTVPPDSSFYTTSDDLYTHVIEWNQAEDELLIDTYDNVTGQLVDEPTQLGFRRLVYLVLSGYQLSPDQLELTREGDRYYAMVAISQGLVSSFFTVSADQFGTNIETKSYGVLADDHTHRTGCHRDIVRFYPSKGLVLESVSCSEKFLNAQEMRLVRGDGAVQYSLGHDIDLYEIMTEDQELLKKEADDLHFLGVASGKPYFATGWPAKGMGWWTIKNIVEVDPLSGKKTVLPVEYPDETYEYAEFSNDVKPNELPLRSLEESKGSLGPTHYLNVQTLQMRSANND